MIWGIRCEGDGRDTIVPIKPLHGTEAVSDAQEECQTMSDNTSRMRGGPITIGGFAGFGLGVFWYALGKVGFWWAVVYGLFWIPWLGYRVAEMLQLGQ